MSDRSASLKRSILRSSRAFSRISARSARLRKNQRTDGNRKCVAKLIVAKPSIRIRSQTGTATVPNICLPCPKAKTSSMASSLLRQPGDDETKSNEEPCRSAAIDIGMICRVCPS